MTRHETPLGNPVLLVATRKGAWLYHADAARRSWRVDGPHFLGHIVNHLVLDPRDGRTLLAAAKTGHLGPTLFRSTDLGRTWQEAARPPAFGPAANGLAARAVDHTFWLTPGPAGDPGVWYAGTSPQGLFRSEDGGNTWAPFSCINDDPQYRQWFGKVQDGTPDGPKLHSIIVDPRDLSHLYFAMSGGGVHESTDGGRSFAPLVDGMEVVEGFDPTDVSFHDPHCVRLCPGNPDRLYQQNHCGIYRLDRPGRRWERIGRNMPREVGDIGFPLVLHPRDERTAWVFPMDGSDVWPRTSPAGQPAVYVTRDGGATWQRHNAGLPAEQAWWTVKRQAMTADREAAVASTSAPPAANCGRAATKAGSGNAWPSTCRKSTRWKRRIRDERAGAMRVLIPSALHSYTGRPWVEAQGTTVAAVLDDLDRQFPGIRFRMIDEQGHIRRHIRLFYQRKMVLDLKMLLREDNELMIVQALSGG